MCPALPSPPPPMSKAGLRSPRACMRTPPALWWVLIPKYSLRIGLKHNARQQLVAFLKAEHPNDAGIVYRLSRKKTEETASWLPRRATALPYHKAPGRGTCGISARFLREEAIVMVATIAFGMGIDKPDVRFGRTSICPRPSRRIIRRRGARPRRRTGQCLDDLWPAGCDQTGQMMQSSQGSEQHKRIEQHRLNAMLGLCEITSCRRQALLATARPTPSLR